jgi:gallate 1-beta-glucosyltransferase
MGSEPPLPHVLMVSFPGQGHVNPLLRLAKRVAAKGVLITFTTTSDTGHQILSSSDVNPADDGFPIGSGRLRFEFLDMNWNTTDGQVPALDDSMVHLETVGPATFADLIRKQSVAGRPVITSQSHNSLLMASIYIIYLHK